MIAAPETQTPGASPGSAEETTNTTIVPSFGDDRKEKDLRTLIAQMAMAGHSVHTLASGGFLVVATKWAGMCRECPTMHALVAFARQIGALK